MEDQLFYLIKDYGFPTFFCLLLVYTIRFIVTKGLDVIGKMSNVVNDNTIAMNDLKVAIKVLTKK